MKLKAMVKKLPPPFYESLIEAKVKADYSLAYIFSRARFLSSLYYCFFSGSFGREHQAVLLGRLEFMRSLMRKGGSRASLRRNIHRLEKGLIMRPRRKVFAEDYIMETVNCFEEIKSTLTRHERKWATDVLSTYFSVVDSSPSIKLAKQYFSPTCSEDEMEVHAPYSHEVLPELPFGYEELLQLFKRRRSVRWYQQREVDMDLIHHAVQAATYAPSACNRQPFKFFVANQKEQAAEIASYALGTAGFNSNIPCTIAVVGDLSAYAAERDRHVIYIDGALAAMQLMLSLETLGLSTCAINWPDLEHQEILISRKLQLGFHERVIMLISVGYADPSGGVPYSQKKSSEDLIVYTGESK